MEKVISWINAGAASGQFSDEEAQEAKKCLAADNKIPRIKAAELLQCSLRVLDLYVKKGLLTKYKRGGSTFFLEKDIKNFTSAVNS